MKSTKGKTLKQKEFIKAWEDMVAEQKADLARVTDGFMTKEVYDFKWGPEIHTHQ